MSERSHKAGYDPQEYSCQASYSRREFATDRHETEYALMNIERLRNARGLNQDDLAEMADIKQSTISKIENGFDGVTLRVLKRIAIALEVEVRDLFDDERTAAEQSLIAAFRNLSPARQQGWLDLAETLTLPDPKGSKESE